MYQIPELLKYPRLLHSFSVTHEGNMAYWILGQKQDTKKVLENRERLLSKLGLDIKKGVCLFVVHGNEVVVANRKDAGKSMLSVEHAVRADGIVTDQRDLFLFVLVADCLPIIYYDPRNECLGIVHAGRRGTEQEIAKKGVQRMQNVFNTDPKDLIISLGPAARIPEYYKDFVGDSKKQLLEKGVLEKNIFDCKINTITDERFFSHRRDVNQGIKDQGRFACVVSLR